MSEPDSGAARPIHLLPTFSTGEGRLPGTRFHNSYQMRYSASSGRLARLKSRSPNKVRVSLPSSLLSALVRNVDPMLTTPVPTLQVRLLEVEATPRSSEYDRSAGMRAADRAQVRHRFRGRILEVKDDRFLAVLESQAPDNSQYEVEIPLHDLADPQRAYVESGAEFSLSLTIRHGQEFDQQVRREFTFDDETDELPLFDAAALERARVAAARQRQIWEDSARMFDDEFDSPAEG